MKNKFFRVVFLVSSFFLFSCGGESTNESQELNDTLVSQEITEENRVDQVAENSSQNVESDKLAAQTNI